MKDASPFKPFIPAEKVIPEITFTSVLLGCLLSVIFGAANAYLGLRVGLTISASIPAAVISMGIVRMILKKNSILENNMVQTIGSAGESVAAGAIFTLPALFMWCQEWGLESPSLISIAVIALCGGGLGALFMIPLRRALIVNEHGSLPYPEGTACSEVLLAGEEGGSKAATVFAGLGIAGVYKLIADGLQLFPSKIHFEFHRYRGAAVGADVLPALLGVGYICGPRIASYMLCGGILSWLVLMPLISIFGATDILFPSMESVGALSSQEIWEHYIKYIGAGALAAGGVIRLILMLPLLLRTFCKAVKGYFTKAPAANLARTDQDIPMSTIVVMICAIILVLWISPAIPVTPIGAIAIALLGFFFTAVTSRLVGLIGSSNNPISGIAISTLLIATFVLKAGGHVGQDGMFRAIAIGSVICIAAAVAGDTSQDLKTGYILGATPRKQQWGELIGVAVSSLTIGGTLYLFHAAWGFGAADSNGFVTLPAPQSTLMKIVVEGVMEGDLPWALIIAGALLAVVVLILRIPVLPFAVGFYLPIHLSVTIMIGGLIRLWLEKRKVRTEQERRDSVDSGLLYASGMIAGEGIVGILLAVLAIIPIGVTASGETMMLADKISLFAWVDSHLGNAAPIVSAIAFLLLILSLLKYSAWKNRADIQ